MAPGMNELGSPGVHPNGEHSGRIEWRSVSKSKVTLPPSVSAWLCDSPIAERIEVACHEPLRTVAEVVKSLRVSPKDVLKSLVVITDRGLVLTCVPGSSQIDMLRVEAV